MYNVYVRVCMCACACVYIRARTLAPVEDNGLELPLAVNCRSSKTSGNENRETMLYTYSACNEIRN